MLLPSDFIEQYKKRLQIKKVNLAVNFNNLEEPKSFPSIDYYNQISAVYSSNIEGNSLDINSFVHSEGSSKKKEKQEIEDLLLAYRFAEKSELNEEHFLLAHRMFSGGFLIQQKRGKYRQEKVGVLSSKGLVYMAIEEDKVVAEMKKLFLEIQVLLERELNLEEVFYYASMLHLRLAHIHPFADGNGRAARLLEKWFLAQKIGTKAWWIQSEKYYFNQHQSYYQNLNLGVNYYELDYTRCVDFLSMLGESF